MSVDPPLGYPDDLPDVTITRPWQRLLVEPRRAERVRRSPQAHWYAVAAVCPGAFMGQLDASIVTVALPSLQHSFHAGLGSVTWVGLSYLVTLVAIVPAVGRWADMAGRKLLYTYGFVVFVAGSAACGLAPSLGALEAFRVVQAVGAAMLQANSVAIIYLAMPRDRLGRGIGIQGASQALGLAVGPGIGGALIAAFGWRAIFLVNVPFGVVGTVLGWFLIPRSRHLQARARFDWAGLVCFAGAVVALLWAVSFGDTAGWGSPRVAAALAVAAGAGALFVARERSAPAPMVDLRLLSRPQFSAGVTSGLLSYMVLFGLLFLVPFYLERARGLGSGPTGLVLTALPVGIGLAAPLGGRWADRLGPRVVTVGGMVLAAGFVGLLGPVRAGTAAVALVLAGVGVGLGLYTPANNAAIMAAAPRQQSGVAGGILNMTRGIGTALGLAVTSLVFTVAAGGGPHPGPGPTGRAFTVCALFLASVAVVSAGLAVLRGATSGPGSEPPPPGR
jgi:EmrB/QacA subfamily drug resistance transporter